MPVRGLEMGETGPALRRNLGHMLDAIDRVFQGGAAPQLLQFDGFPLQGGRKWTRREASELAIELPGVETEAIGVKCREYGTWIVFGAYAHDPDWPGHVLSITTVMDDTGRIVDRHWKSCRTRGVFKDPDLFTTTIHDVLDRYVEMYGRDAVIPVTRTPLGNIATTAVQCEPELIRAMAMKGAEIVLRAASGGCSRIDIQACAMHNGIYSSMVLDPGSVRCGPLPGDAHCAAAIYGPDGTAIAESSGRVQHLVSAQILIGDLRARRCAPALPMEMCGDVFDRYQGPFAPGSWLRRMPRSLEEAVHHHRQTSRWK